MSLVPLLVVVLGPLVGAVVVDVLVGDPAEGSWRERWYPPVLVGRLALVLDARIPRDDPVRERQAGLLLWVAVVGPAAFLAGLLVAVLGPGAESAVGALLAGAGARFPVRAALEGAIYTVAVGGWLKSSFTLSGLLEFCQRPLGQPLEAKRRAVAQVVNRPTGGLSDELLNSALIESAVENTTDSVLGPLLGYCVLGLPGAVAYRAVNTLDALLGHRDRPRRYVGQVSASIDHAVNIIPDRLTALLLRLLSSGPRASPTIRSAAGVIVPRSIVAAATVLRVRLERQGTYVIGPEFRPPTEGDVQRVLRTVKYAGLVGALLGAAVIGGLVVAGWWYFL